MNLRNATLSQLLYIARFTDKTSEAQDELIRRIVDGFHNNHTASAQARGRAGDTGFIEKRICNNVSTHRAR